MTLGWLDDPAAVTRAIAEYRRIGRVAFLAKYGFGPALEIYLRDGGFDFESKAIAGAALGYQYPDRRSRGLNVFTGGEGVTRRLEDLGFDVRRTRRPRLTPEPARDGPTSARLLEGETYTRDDLRAIFGVTDATLKNGVFRPKGSSSIWLFVTEEKAKGRTQYRDHLVDDVLDWQGQSLGRTDRMIIEHALRELELLVFYRRRVYEFPGAAFRFVGPFQYVEHRGASPTTFVLRKAGTGSETSEPAPPVDLDPAGVPDNRDKVIRAITARRGQARFRSRLIAAYGRCCVSGSQALAVLEAAHIHPYRGERTSVITNGLLLRSDIHTLFDLFLLGVDPVTRKVLIAPALRGTEYEAYAGKPLHEPKDAAQRPGRKVLEWHLGQMAV